MVTRLQEPAARIEALVEDAIEAHGSPAVWVAFSGGVDSTALLLACRRVIAKLPQVTLRALHVNHRLHDDADRWAEHCAAVCKRLEVAFSAATVDVAREGNIEANARAARYQAFAEHLQDGAVILLGHHRQDQTETVLYRLFQGRGLAPMRAGGELAGARFVRPLLALERASLAAYVRAQGVPWIDDDSNDDVRLSRNFLRHEVIPRLAERWRGLHLAVHRVAEAHVQTGSALQHELTKLGDTLDVAELPPQRATRLEWLRAYLQTRGVYKVSDKALLAFDAQLSQGGHAELDCGAAQLHGYAERLYFERYGDAPPAGAFSLAVGEELDFGFGRLSLRPAAAADALSFVYPGPLSVRFRHGGEVLRVAPQAQTRSVKQIFAEARIPPWRRGRYPLLYWRDRLVCVPGLALSVDDACPRAAAAEQRVGDTICVALWHAAGGSRPGRVK